MLRKEVYYDFIKSSFRLIRHICLINFDLTFKFKKYLLWFAVLFQFLNPDVYFSVIDILIAKFHIFKESNHNFFLFNQFFIEGYFFLVKSIEFDYLR